MARKPFLASEGFKVFRGLGQQDIALGSIASVSFFLAVSQFSWQCSDWHYKLKKLASDPPVLSLLSTESPALLAGFVFLAFTAR